MKQERAVRTRRELIHSAATVFDHHGFAEATLSMISTGAGVSRGALHFHFANKATVRAAVEFEAVQALRGAVRNVYSGRESALQALVDSTHALGYALAGDVVARAGFRLGCESSSPLDLRNEWLRYVRGMLAEAAHHGELLPGIPLRTVAATVVAATTGFETLGQYDRSWLSHRVLTGFWQVLLPSVATASTLRTVDPAGTAPVFEDPRETPPRDADRIPVESRVNVLG